MAPAAAVEVHKYAISYQYVTNYGATSWIYVSPPVDTKTGEVFSLSQVWVINFLPPGAPSGKTQTVESGWIVYPQEFTKTKAVLFVYFTADGYDKTGCYNLCKKTTKGYVAPGFVQTNKSVELGGTFKHYCTVDSQQCYQIFNWELYEGNWWFCFSNYMTKASCVGYYPVEMFEGGPLATQSTYINFGGETNGTTAWGPMGSGKPASAGWPQAALQANVTAGRPITDQGEWPVEASLTGTNLSPCYTDIITNNSSTEYGSYLFFGGPGGKDC